MYVLETRKIQEDYDKSMYTNKKIEQPSETALTELDHIRSIESLDSVQR